MFIDASFFLGMHDRDETRRLRSLSYFTRNFSSQPRMNFEQIGICDAVIWAQSRQVQDLYYPFMDRLHSDMAIQRSGYTYDDINAALSHPHLKQMDPEQALLVGQLFRRGGQLATHDPVLRTLDCLQGRLWRDDQDAAPVSFPSELQELYDASRAFVYNADG
ncbi:DUF6190 family protein [Achromobacter pestifer]|uniref:DUF6190 family protein n=1 Tax=Achromobacter pestifer TaxID=1353889 RepID=UPI001FEC41C5|nr:DUF6190 family protein [Achromobacter pestifer]